MLYCISKLVPYRFSRSLSISLSLSEPVLLIQTTSICILWTVSIKDKSRRCESQFVPNHPK